MNEILCNKKYNPLLLEMLHSSVNIDLINKDKKLTMYYLAQNYGSEGWVLREFENIEDILTYIQDEGGDNCPFKIFKELKLQVIEE